MPCKASPLTQLRISKFDNEVAIQRRASFRETPFGGRENPEEVPGPGPGHRGESAQSPDRRPGQEKVFGALGLDSRAILLFDPKTNQFEARRCFILLC